MKKLTIATRTSDLALWQAYHIKARIEASYPDITVELNKIVSNGDKVLDKPLALIGGKGHFTKELEDEMLAGNADLAVHSLKDVPTYIPEGLELVAVTQRQDQSDVFLSHKYKSLEELPQGAVVGTTSLRRRMQLLNRRPDLRVKDLRGNVNTRLRKLGEGQYDAIILAFIGLHRLDLPVHTQMIFVIDLKSVHSKIYHLAIKTLGIDLPHCYKRSAVLLPCSKNREFVEVNIIF